MELQSYELGCFVNIYLKNNINSKFYNSRICPVCGQKLMRLTYTTHLRKFHYEKSIYMPIDEIKRGIWFSEYDSLYNLKWLYESVIWQLDYIKEVYGSSPYFTHEIWNINMTNAIAQREYYRNKLLQADIIHNQFKSHNIHLSKTN